MQLCNETITALFVQTPDTIPCCSYSVKTYRDHWRKWNVSCYTAKSMEMEHKEIEIEIIIFVLLIHVMKSCVTLLELPSSVQSLKRTSTYCEQCYTSHYIWNVFIVYVYVRQTVTSTQKAWKMYVRSYVRPRTYRQRQQCSSCLLLSFNSNFLNIFLNLA